MKWEVVSLSIDAPLIPEPAGKDTGIPGACLECDRKKKKKATKNSSNKQNFFRRGMGGGRVEGRSKQFQD